MAWIRIAGFGVIALGLIGCKETIDSGNLRTRGIAMITKVTATSESSVVVHTELVAGGDESNTFVILRDGDELIADADGDEMEMEAVDEGVYEAEFDVGLGGTVFTVNLERDDDDSAPDNSGSLPEPFDITSDFGATPMSRAEEMEVTWDPSGESDDMQIEFDDDAGESCIFMKRDTIAGDPGAYTVEAAFLDGTGPDDEQESCDVIATITRSRSGSTDNGLDDESSFVLEQVRSVDFVSAP